MICGPVYDWLEVSLKVDISRAQSASDISTDGWSLTSDLSDVFQFSGITRFNSAHNFDCSRDVCMFLGSFGCGKTTLHIITSCK